MTYEQWANNETVVVDRGELPETSEQSAKLYAIYVKKSKSMLRLGIEFSEKDGKSAPSSDYVAHIVRCTLDSCDTNWGHTSNSGDCFEGHVIHYHVQLTSTSQIHALANEIREAIERMSKDDRNAYLASCVS